MITKQYTQKVEGAGAAGMFKIAAFKGGVLQRETPWQKNKVMNNTDRGVQLLIQHMAGITTNPIDIDTLSIGTGSSPRTTAMTDLEVPVTTGIPYADRGAISNEWAGDFFILDAELPDDTYNEIGIFMHELMYATALIDGGFSKVTGEDLLISYKATLTPS